MGSVVPFDFESHAVRVVMRDGAPWFVLVDICQVLEVGNPSDVVRRLDGDEITLDTIEGSHRTTNLVNESGLYALILTSRKPAAKRFRKWVTAEVLPALRTRGRYELPGAEDMREISTERLLELLQSENELLRSKVPAPRPKRKATVPLTDEERQEILRLSKAGLSGGQIARVTGRSRATISLLLSGFRVIDGGAA